MFPILFSLGPITLKTFSIFLAAAFLFSSFIFWKRGREEHYKEDQLFDGFLLSVLVGLFAARLGFIILNFSQFGASPLQWLDIISKPGFNGLAGVVIAGLYLYRYAQKNKWDAFEIMDFWATAMALGLGLVYFGMFFDGSGYGYPTGYSWGMVFPQLVEPHHPAQLYLSGFYFILFIYLFWVEYKYRTFEWYRSGRKTAQTGFVLSSFIIMSGLAQVLITFFRPPVLQILTINGDRLIAFAILIVGILLLYVRAGRALPFTEESRKRKARLERLKSEQVIS